MLLFQSIMEDKYDCPLENLIENNQKRRLIMQQRMQNITKLTFNYIIFSK